MLVLDDRLHPITPIKAMSLTSWAKRSPSNTSIILAVGILVFGANLYYRDRPSANNVSDNGSAIAEVNASSKVKAFLKMIRWAEGTDGADGYRTIFSGAKFDDFSKHPDKVYSTIFKGKTLRSAAAGAYQFMPDTWEEKREKLNLPDFSPKSQDIAAIDLLNDVGAIALVESDQINKAIFVACGKFASLPCFEGDTVGAYDQSVKPMPALLQRYKENLEANK